MRKKTGKGGAEAMDTRELFARLIQCEAGGEGTDGMMGVATVVMNRATIGGHEI